MATHPYIEFVGTPIWRRTARTIASLEANQDIALTTVRAYVIGYICEQLAKGGLLSRGAVARPPGRTRSKARLQPTPSRKPNLR